MNPKKESKIWASIQKVSHCALYLIEGLDAHGARKVLQRVNAYIDFGHFPGRDRLRREALHQQCGVVSGRRGASNFYEDSSIPNTFKFATTNLVRILGIIDASLNEYEPRIPQL
mgnify:CR=1 FL=1